MHSVMTEAGKKAVIEGKFPDGVIKGNVGFTLEEIHKGYIIFYLALYDGDKVIWKQGPYSATCGSTIQIEEWIGSTTLRLRDA